MTTVDLPGRGTPQNGPPLPLPAVVLLVLTVSSAVLGSNAPRPGDDAPEIARYVGTHHGTLCALALVVSATSVPVAIWAAVVRHRLRHLGVTAPGVSMAFAGGILAAAAITGSGIAIWAAAESAGQTEPAVTRALLLLAFGSGGPGYVVPCALLVAGVAVPALVLGLLPRVLAATGLVLAAAGMGTTFALVSSAFYPLLPVGRFGLLAWIVVVSFVLPTTAR